ncbi:hypothetical protein PTTG_06005, partial [Puccinia triticina 1-1 BBBD Race 1]
MSKQLANTKLSCHLTQAETHPFTLLFTTVIVEQMQSLATQAIFSSATATNTIIPTTSRYITMLKPPSHTSLGLSSPATRAPSLATATARCGPRS